MLVVDLEEDLKEGEDSKKDHLEAEEHPKFLYSNIVSLEFMLPEEPKSV